MNKSLILLLSVAAFVLAAAFKTLQPLPLSTTTAAIKSIEERKKFSIRCSPLYIPSADELIQPLTGWGNYSWKITTSSDSAQFYFDQGINMYYAFHIIESRASFDKATRFDPACAMAWWGKALAFGPNINDFGYARPSDAYPSAMRAKELKSSSRPLEKALIEAMEVRYSNDSTQQQDKLNEKYTAAMSNVYNSHLRNADAAALYGDALMLLHPWDLYSKNYTPKPWTPELVKVLEAGLELNPKHPGANHYYIHAVEASAKPEQALAAAKLLSTLMPDVAHVTHMPSHIYIRTGYYNKGLSLNDDAIAGFNKYTATFPAVVENASLYLIHNLHMKANCAEMSGNYKAAKEASDQLQNSIPAFYLSMPGALGNYVQYLYETSLFTDLRFGKWDEILSMPVNDTLAYSSVLRHFARGMAYTGKSDVASARKELKQMQSKMGDTALKVPFTPFNSAFDAALVAESILQGSIATALDRKDEAVRYFTKAVTAEDNLIYNEPRDWLLPARQYLGKSLLLKGDYKKAELVFRKDLEINPNNGWALTGLAAVYKSQSEKALYTIVQNRLTDAWRIKDVPIPSPVF